MPPKGVWFMRIAALIASLFLMAGPALAADTEGLVKSVNQEKMTITLEDGETYKLPGEMDVSAIAEGMDIVIAYRELDNGEKQITDMVLPE